MLNDAGAVLLFGVGVCALWPNLWWPLRWLWITITLIVSAGIQVRPRSSSAVRLSDSDVYALRCAVSRWAFSIGEPSSGWSRWRRRTRSLSLRRLSRPTNRKSSRSNNHNARLFTLYIHCHCFYCFDFLSLQNAYRLAFCLVCLSSARSELSSPHTLFLALCGSSEKWRCRPG
jgi:hypothetical protein